ncbi:glycosyltransferase [Lyngbya aestuarii]|nr:glycosyltransferase [Lyngbya aestuarii]
MVSQFQEANLLLRTGKLEEAVAAYRAATAENTSFYPAYQNLGETLWKLGRLDEAIAAFRQAVVLNPGGVWGVYKLGELLRLQGEFQEAVGYLRRAVELKSDLAEFHLGLGAALVQLGLFSEGEGCLRRVLQFSTSSIPTVSLAEAYYFLGVIKSEQQQGAEAVDWYRRGWEIHPGSVDCGLALAKALGKLGRWDEAVDCYRQVAALSESGEVLFALGKALAELQRWEEAIAEYQGAIALGFVGAEVRHYLGYAFNQLGRYEEAVVELRQVLEVNPKSAQVRHQLGYALMQLGRWREAALELRKAVELYPGSAVVWQQLGDVLRELGENEEAAEAYRQALEFKSRTSGYASKLSRALPQIRRVTQKLGANDQGKKYSILKNRNERSTYLNVLFVLYGNIDSNGGYHVQLHANRLLDQGVDCLVVVPDSSDNTDVLRQSLHNLSNTVPILPFSALSIPDSRLPFANGRGPDVIHAWTPREIVRKFVERLLKQYSCPLVIHLEDNEEYLTEAKVGRPFAELAKLPEVELDKIIPGDRYHPIKGKAFLQQAQGLTMIIETLKGFNTGNVPELVLAPPVDESLFYPRPINQDLRRSLGIPEGHVVLAYTGNVHSGNRDEVRELYKAVEILNQQGCPTVLLRTGLNREEMGVESWGRIYEKYLGWVEREQVPEILAAADVLVQSGVPGVFNDQRVPSKLLEYFAMGRPVVLPKTNLGLRVKHGQEGYVLERSDAQGIAGAVQQIKADQELARRLSDGAVEFYLSQLEQGLMGTQLNDFYCRLTGNVSSFSDLVCGKYKTYPNFTGKRQAEGGLRLSGNSKNTTSKEPLVSIITPVYNNSITFERCINSVLNQKYSNIEYIVIDGGSDQATLDIILKYSDKIDYFVSEPDGGIYNAMNKGLELAYGDYICILNSDDWYLPDFVSSCVEVAMSKQSEIVYTYYKHGENELTTEGINEGVFLGHLNVCHNTFLVSKSCYNKIGKYSEKYRIVSDAVWIRKAFKEGIKFDLVPDFLFVLSEGGLSSGNTPETRQLFISEVIISYKNEFVFLENSDAEEIYLFRFNKNRISKIIDIAQKYRQESTFIQSLAKYIHYCFKHRDNFKLSRTEASTTFLEFIKVSNQFNIPKNSIRISTNQGCFSKIIDSIDSTASQNKSSRTKVILHFVTVFSAPSETFIYDLLNRLENETSFDNYILYEHKILENERPYQKGLYIPWQDFREEVRNEIYKYIFTKINPDVVVAHFALNEWKLSKRLKPLDISVPTISMTHGIDVFSMRNNPKYKKYLLEDFCKRENTSFTAVSNYLISELESHGVPKNKITLIHNTVNSQFFSHRKKSNYFKKGRTLKLLAIGRLVEWKGHTYLLQGLKFFKDEFYDDVHLTIVYGNGRDYYEKTKTEIERLNLYSQVSLIPFVDFLKNINFFHSFDIFIQPSTYSKDGLNRSETFGVAVLEAIVSGLPVIVTDAGALPEVIGYENKFAQVVPHADGIAIGKALEFFLKNGECFADNIEYATERISLFSSKRQTLLLGQEIIKVSQSKLNAVLFSSSTIQGAGYAAFRIHKGLLNTRIHPTLFTTVRNHKSFPGVQVVSDPLNNNGETWRILQDPSISKPGLTIFSINHPLINSKQLASMVADADVVNLHWTARFLSIENIAQLSNMGKPLVITIRDMNPLTGGCHYFHGCHKWQNSCYNCPQLVDTFDNFPSKVLNAKRHYYNFDNITIVTLSRHSAEIVKKSPYFNQCRIEIIPNSIETNIFKPHNKNEARKKLGLPLNRKIIGYLPSYSSRVKGYQEMLEVLDLFYHKYSELNPLIMLIGSRTPVNEQIQLENKSIGYINDNEKLAIAYSAADVVVVPSLEETFSNTTAESISCGTPVVGFQTGAIPDMVKDGVTGYTFPVGDVKGLAKGIYATLTGKSMSDDCRVYAEKNLSFMIQAQLYEELFYDLYIHDKMKDKVSKLFNYEFLSYFPETTPTIMNLLISKIMKIK